MVSDIVVYGDDDAKKDDLHDLAKRAARAQRAHREKCEAADLDPAEYNTFVVTSMASGWPDPDGS
jgi:hypothetical protein